MPSNNFNDMVPPRRSIRDIPLPDRPNRSAPPPPMEKPKPSPRHVAVVDEEHPSTESLYRENREQEEREEKVVRPRKSFSRRKTMAVILSIAGVLVLGGAFVAISSLLSKATVEITTRSKPVSVETNLLAQKNPSLEGVLFTPLILQKEVETVMQPSGQRKMERKASGKIIVYNNHSSAPQRLIKNTRFETPDGLIFRVPETVTIPGKSGATPGSLEVTVSADTAGDKHNIGLTDFTIPGFKGDPRYTTFYARSVTPMTGGLIGVMKVVSNDILESTDKQLRERAIEELQKEVATRASSTAIVFKESYNLKEDSVMQQEVADGVRISKMVTLEAPAFDNASLARAVGRKAISDFDGEEIELLSPESLVFSYVPVDAGLSFATAESFSFNLKGTSTLAWNFDEAQLKRDLVGKEKENMKVVLGGYPSIEEATATIFPFWKSSFPTKENRIELNISR